MVEANQADWVLQKFVVQVWELVLVEKGEQKQNYLEEEV